jgi:hypothetical protein
MRRISLMIISRVRLEPERALRWGPAHAAVGCGQAPGVHPPVPRRQRLAATPADDVVRSRRAGRHDDVLARETLRVGADLSAHRFPLRVVAVVQPGQGVGDLVQDRVAHLVLVIERDQVSGEADGLDGGGAAGAAVLGLADAGHAELAFSG